MMLILLILIAMLILYMSQINFRTIYLSFKLPGPFPLPFVGNGLFYINKKPSEIWETGVQLYKKYGDVLAIWLGSEFSCTLSDPEDVEVILSSSKFIEKAYSYRYLKPWLNEGLLLSKGSKWYQRRKILTPAFHFGVLEQYVEIFNRQSSIFVDILSKYNPCYKVEMFPLIRLCTLDIICESAMGVELNAQRNSNSDYVKAVHTINHVIHLRTFGVLLRSDLIFRFSSLYQQQKNALKILHGFTDKVIRERRQKLVSQEKDGNDISDGKSRKGGTFLDILLQGNIDGKALSNLDIREEVDTFMFEGHDTTVSALTFSFYCIAKYPEVQRKCFQEIRDVLGDDCTTPVTCNDLNNLTYLDLVIKETLRLYPSVPLIGRNLTEELTIGKNTYPKGTSIAISPVFMMINKTQEFQPERFLEEKSDEKYTFSYIPFSAGPRNCIGQKFAVLEIKTLVSKVLRHFEVSLAEDSLKTPALLGALVTTPKDKINFHFLPRLY